MPVPMTAEEIARDLTARIDAGEYPPDTKLPSYRELMALYDVGYTTVAKVIWMLRDRGIVIGAPGRGVFVAPAEGGSSE